MRTRNELERLAAAGRPLLAEADALVNAAEEGRILERILASDRAPARPRRLRPALVLAAAVVIVAIAVALGSIVTHRGSSPATTQHHGDAAPLSGAKIQLAGFHFRTPAGFQDSSSPCQGGATDRFSAAASADGGCVEAFFMLSTGKYAIAPDAKAIEVAGTQGFLVTGSDSLTLYAPLPKEGEDLAYLMLVGKGLTADQLVAIAESGLPSSR